MKIFEDKERTDLNFAKHLDNTYNFYDRSAKHEFAQSRNMINAWFETYPSSEQVELKARFKKSFYPAFFELFIHQLFTKQGFILTPHPELTHTDKRPDFLAEKDGISFYIEAKEVSDTSEAEVSLNKRMNTIYDAISKINLPDFWLSLIEVEIKGKRQPSGKKIVDLIEKQIRDYDPEYIANQIRADGWSNIEHITIDNADIKLTARLFPKSTELRSDKNLPAIGVYPIESHWGGPEASIKNAIHKKASRYGKLDKPYLICLNAFSKTSINTIGVEAAILGSLIYTWSNNEGDRDARFERARDGVFLSHTGPTMTRVSGVFITSIFPSNIYSASHRLIKHPYAKHELDFSRLGLSYQQLEDTHWQDAPGHCIHDILDK